MGVITLDDIFEYWPKRLDDSEVEKDLKKLYGAAKRNGLSISQTYNGQVAEDKDWELIQCLKKYFRTERFVILRYDSWIMSRLIESGVNPESLRQDYDEFWRESLLPKARRFANEWSFVDAHSKKVRTAKNFATDPYCKRCKVGRTDCCRAKFRLTEGIIAAFSESKIWIGFEHQNPLQLASVNTAGEPAIPIPCFSWSKESGFSNPGNDCLAPWAKFSSFSTPNYDPKQAIELFRELIVRCTIKSMKKYSLHPHL